MEKVYDLAILGGGPAGLTSAIYSSRYGMKTLVISKEIGGTMASYDSKIENYPGFSGSGANLMKKFYKQAKSFGAEFLNDDLISIGKEKGNFLIMTGKGKIYSKAVVIALGTQRRKLNIAGEDKFLGKGVSYCATCDANFFKKKTVVVIGGGDSACKASEILVGIAGKVYMVYRGLEHKCESFVSNRLKKNKNFECVCDSMPVEIKGGDSVEELVIERKGKKDSLKVDGVFIEIGNLPVSDIAKLLGLNLDEGGYIIVDEDMNTNVPGVYAAGDVVKGKLKQVVIAAGQGARAAKSAFDFIKR